MFGRRRAAAAPGAEQPAPVSVDTLAGAAQLGDTSGSGEVAPWNQLQPYGGAGVGTMGRAVLGQGLPALPDLPPDSVYQDRALFGGVRTFPAFGEYLPEPPLSGGFRLMANRPPIVMVEGGAMQPQSYVEPAEWREAPPVVNLCRTVRAPEPSGFAGMSGVN